MLVCCCKKFEEREGFTRSAVQVGEVQDIGGAADGVARGAETDLALLDGRGEGNDGHGEDSGDGKLHVEGWLMVLG
jgi:hypothetical protein